MRQYEMFELAIPGPVLSDHWAQADVKAAFTHGSTTVTVPGFYAGDGTYKVRFLPMEPGKYTWRISGAVSAEGQENCAPATTHGPIHTQGRGFAYADGTPYHPFGTTIYALAHQPAELIDRTMETLSKAPFNKVRMCVFPKNYDFNQNEPPYYAFEKNADGTWDTSRPCFAFWDAFEARLYQLDKMGIQVDLILFHPYDRWGFDGMGHDKDLVYLDYLTRRLAAFPNIWWSLANEHELTHRTKEQWYDIENFVSAHDPYHHPLSCHNIFTLWDANRPNTTHASIQSKDLTQLNRWIARYPGKPVIIDECAYEGNIEPFWGSITGQEMVRRFWMCVSQGAYCTHGETFYSDDDVLWWSKGGVLHGESPERIAFCRKIIESLPGQLEGTASFLQPALQLRDMDEAQREAALSQLPEMLRRLLLALIASPDAESFANSEIGWYGHIGTDVYLRFHADRPIARDTIELPGDKTYTIRVLDTWAMTDEVVATGVCGKYTVPLPGRENMAVLAIAESHS